jgi:hypothetical protein
MRSFARHAPAGAPFWIPKRMTSEGLSRIAALGLCRVPSLPDGHGCQFWRDRPPCQGWSTAFYGSGGVNCAEFRGSGCRAAAASLRSWIRIAPGSGRARVRACRAGFPKKSISASSALTPRAASRSARSRKLSGFDGGANWMGSMGSPSFQSGDGGSGSSISGALNIRQPDGSRGQATVTGINPRTRGCLGVCGIARGALGNWRNLGNARIVK